MVKAALLGASLAPSLAHRILKRLQEANYQIFPINPKYEQIDDTACFASLEELPVLPEVVIFMVNPKLSVQLLPQLEKLGIKKARFQPETFDKEVVALAEELGLSYEDQKCLLIAPPDALANFVAKK
ncbi:MAG: CoA-binding protein [bacterium]|nr:CoA-binding protein [bacterium]